jgi:hypothetical protein
MGRGVWAPAPLRNCALGRDDRYTRFIVTETFGPFLMVW